MEPIRSLRKVSATSSRRSFLRLEGKRETRKHSTGGMACRTGGRLPGGVRCSEFRHQAEAEAEAFNPLIIASASAGIKKGAVRFRASARNLPEQIERTVAIRVEVEAGDTEAAARALMPKPRLKLGFKGRKPGQ